jgi:hypothetical protein
MNSEQHRAFTENVFWHTVGVVNLVRVQGKTSTGTAISVEEMGAGSACSWMGKKLVLTAKHVVAGAEPSELAFFTRPSGQIGWVTRDGPPAFAERVPLRIEEIVESPRQDLAALILTGGEADRSQLHFCDLPACLAPVPSGPGVTLLIGYPGDQSFPIATVRRRNGSVHHDLVAVPEAFWGSIVDNPPRFLSSDYDPARHFLLRFDPSEEGSMPHGYSGAGVWYQRSGKHALWVAQPVLAGLQTSWYARSKLMVAIRSEVVREFLEGTLGQ